LRETTVNSNRSNPQQAQTNVIPEERSPDKPPIQPVIAKNRKASLETVKALKLLVKGPNKQIRWFGTACYFPEKRRFFPVLRQRRVRTRLPAQPKKPGLTEHWRSSSG
jgi:hypothetical protein